MEGIDDYLGKGFEKKEGFKTAVENAVRNVNMRSRIRAMIKGQNDKEHEEYGGSLFQK